MNIEELREVCISLPGVSESFPFDNETLVFKVGGKMFLLIGLNNADRCNVKCDPEEALRLRERYTEVMPGYHMNKTHWNTVIINGSLSHQFLIQQIKKSYQLVYDKLPRKLREQIQQEVKQ